MLRDKRGPQMTNSPAAYRASIQEGRGNFSEERKKEIAEDIRAGKTDFKRFCEKLVGVRVHPGQLDVWSLLNEKDYGTLAAANGWGKTAFYALLVLHATFYMDWAPLRQQQYKSLVMGPELKHALLTHNEIEKLRINRSELQYWDEDAGGDGKMHPFLLASKLIPYNTKDQHAAFKWEHNGSILLFESAVQKAKSIEGQAFNLIIYDEARLEDHLKFIVEEVFLARGTRTEGMRIVLGSTPLMDSFEFMEYVKKGERDNQDWWSRTGSIDENIYLSKKQLAKISRNLDERVRDQVLGGKFVEPPDSYFVRDRVLECMSQDSSEEPDIDSFVGKAVKGHTYVGGLDTAVSETGDYSVLTVWDATAAPHRVVFEKVFQRGMSTSEVLAYTFTVIDEFQCQIGFDAQGPLGVELTLQAGAGVELGWLVPIKFGGGYSRTKADALSNFRHFINNRLWDCPNIPGLMAQIVSYKTKDHNLKKDRLMAQVYAAWVAKDYLTPDQIEGLSIPDSGNYYKSAPGPFVRQTGMKPMSAGRKGYMQWVSNQRYLDKRREYDGRI